MPMNKIENGNKWKAPSKNIRGSFKVKWSLFMIYLLVTTFFEKNDKLSCISSPFFTCIKTRDTFALTYNV